MLNHWSQAGGPVLNGQAPRGGAWIAVILVSLSTLAGSWLVRANSRRLAGWLAAASAVMLITAVTDMLPDAWRDAREEGVALWVIGIAMAVGFLVITYFTRKGCGHDHSGSRPAGAHAPGRHRPIKQVIDAALFGGMGTATALTAHRAIEGATLALTGSVVVVLALMVHSASEGLALTALLDIAGQRVAPWMVAACVSPAVGVVTAFVSPIPGGAVPVLLAMVTGVMLRTAFVGLKLATRERGGLSPWQVTVAAAAAVGIGALLLLAH
ncbi:hypothetical protein Skr01_48230 [Sphaerisporangium krabiense]|nr:hypothetical protein Skr01_48230 [Sphaerisporangium krabiense]